MIAAVSSVVGRTTGSAAEPPVSLTPSSPAGASRERLGPPARSGFRRRLAQRRSRHAEVRFIEYMDVGGATGWSLEAVVSRREILERLTERFGPIAPVPGRESAPAERFRLEDGTTFGIIGSTTEPFCAACDRSRLTADGLWLLCLYARGGLDLRRPLREGATRDEIVHLVATVWAMRADRGAEERLASPARDVLIPVAALKRDAHLEMHTRGG